MGKRDSFRLVSENDPHWKLFWDSYPKRVAKKDARRAWSQLHPDAETVVKMIAALEWQREQPAWLKENGQFVPYPAGWLRAERWTDEPPVKLKTNGNLKGIEQWLHERIG